MDIARTVTRKYLLHILAKKKKKNRKISIEKFLISSTCIVKQCYGRNMSALTIKEHCKCDPNCTAYGDCCIDSPYNVKTRKTFDCVRFSSMSLLSSTTGVYVKRSCSVMRFGWQCSSSIDYEEQIINIRYKIPVTTPSGITYGNQYCAKCFKANDYNLWNISAQCESGSKIMSARNFPPKSYIFNAITSTWNYINENNKTENCTLRPSPPVALRKYLRRCPLNMVQTCPLSASDGYKLGCANYTSTVTDIGGTTYKNEYCALCNNVTSSDLVCRKSTSSYPLSFLRRSTSTTTTTTSRYPNRRRSSSSTSTTDPASSATPPPKPTTTVAPTNSNASNSSVVTREFLHIYVQQNCMDFINSMTLTKMIVETKSTSGIKRSRVKSVVSINNMPLRHCEEPGNDESEVALNEESFALKFAVNSGVLTSAGFTFLHLYDFFFTNSAATLTQKSTASYAIALAIGNVGFLVSNVAEHLCYLLGAITYFGFLTSFFWLSALAFDISCKVWSCVQEFDIFGKNTTNSQRFTAYSLISWIFPPVATFIMTYVAERNDDFILIGRVYETCWFQSDQTLLLFFVFPLTITMSVNVAFYIFSAYVVWVERSAAAKLTTKYGIDFKFHTGLIVISNLMWSVALTAMYYENSILWLCFAFLDAILGLLVYVSSPVKHEITNKISGVMEKFVSSSDRSDIQN